MVQHQKEFRWEKGDLMLLTANVRSARSSSGPRPGGHDGHSPPRRGATPSGLRAWSGKISKQVCRFRPLNERLHQLSTVTVGTTPLDRMTANRLLRSILGSGQRSTSGHEPHRGSIRATTETGRLRRLAAGSADVSYCADAMGRAARLPTWESRGKVAGR